MTTAPLLEVAELEVSHDRRGSRVSLVDGVSLTVGRGEIVGVVGESGCGKSLTMLAILGLLPPRVETTSGHVTFEGRELTDADERELRRVRGRIVSLIPSDAGVALDPVARVGAQLDRALRFHERSLKAAERKAKIVELFRRVRLPEPSEQWSKYPHQLSGGMQQRAVIAAGLMSDPLLLIADEPTTALDVTVQAQVLSLLLEIRARLDAGILFVTHDMTAVAEICDRVVVMYAGQVVESDVVERIVTAPAHPYTRALVATVPPLHGPRPERLATIPGTPPSPGAWPIGCRFRERCELWSQLGQPEKCAVEEPRMPAESGAACHFAEVR